MPVKGLDAREQLAVVAAGDEHLRVRPDGRLQDRERAGCEFVLFELGDFVFAVFWGDGVEGKELEGGEEGGEEGEEEEDDDEEEGLVCFGHVLVGFLFFFCAGNCEGKLHVVKMPGDRGSGDEDEDRGSIDVVIWV